MPDMGEKALTMLREGPSRPRQKKMQKALEQTGRGWWNGPQAEVTGEGGRRGGRV